jgi:hypothetical protein
MLQPGPVGAHGNVAAVDQMGVWQQQFAWQGGSQALAGKAERGAHLPALAVMRGAAGA